MSPCRETAPGASILALQLYVGYPLLKKNLLESEISFRPHLLILSHHQMRTAEFKAQSFDNTP
jgi:hypothetical protein